MSGPGLHFFDEEEEQSVLEVLRSRKISRYRMPDDIQSSKTAIFEQQFATRMDVKYCLATNSCTTALLTGMLALGIGPGDEVIVPGFTFIATMASVAFTGATPILAEVDESLTLDPEDVRQKITPRTKAIIAVHMLGTPCDLTALSAIASNAGIFLIEDVAQSCGGSYQGKPLGSWGQFGAYSFNVFKTITAGDGGALTTNNRELFEQAFSRHDHGFKRFKNGAMDGSEILGLNFRINELVSAVALIQLQKLDKIISQVRSQKMKLRTALGNIEGLTPRRLNDSAGECATTMVYLAQTSKQAEQLAQILKTCTLDKSVKHYYGAMPQLALSLPQLGTQKSYARGLLPKTDDILSRCIGISIGVQDHFLGFGFGIHVLSTQTEIESVAERFRQSWAKVI